MPPLALSSLREEDLIWLMKEYCSQTFLLHPRFISFFDRLWLTTSTTFDSNLNETATMGISLFRSINKQQMVEKLKPVIKMIDIQMATIVYLCEIVKSSTLLEQTPEEMKFYHLMWENRETRDNFELLQLDEASVKQTEEPNEKTRDGDEQCTDDIHDVVIEIKYELLAAHDEEGKQNEEQQLPLTGEQQRKCVDKLMTSAENYGEFFKKLKSAVISSSSDKLGWRQQQSPPLTLADFSSLNEIVNLSKVYQQAQHNDKQQSVELEQINLTTPPQPPRQEAVGDDEAPTMVVVQVLKHLKTFSSQM